MKEFDNFNIGVDVENIERFRNERLKKNKNFLNNIFTKAELKYCFSKNDAGSHLAARYAAKEAVLKAFCGFGNKSRLTCLNYKDIEIVNDSRGVPRVELNKNELKNFYVVLSLSHCREMAIAFAVVKKRGRF